MSDNDIDVGALSEAINDKMDIDSNNANPRLATYAELLEVKNMMLKKLDYANAETVTIPSSGEPSSYTVPSDGYIISFTPNNVSTALTINSHNVLCGGASSAQNRPTNVFVPVSKNDVITRGSYGGTFTFVPEKEA